MTKITRHNYEAYFIDYMEGTLSPSQKDKFIAFLESNPDLKEELQSWEEVKINPDKTIQFSEKNTLKKAHSIFPEEPPFEELCIAKAEGDLTENEASFFDQQIKEEPEKAKLYNLYNKIKLSPDESIIFTEKEKLKVQKSKFIKLNSINYQDIMAVAASIVLIVGLFFGTYTDSSIDNYKYTNLDNFKNNTTLFASISKTKNNGKYTAKNNISIKPTTTINKNLLPIAKVKLKNNFVSSDNSISKIQPTYFSELRSASENEYTTDMHIKTSQNKLVADKMSKSNEGTIINSMDYYADTEQPNRFLLDIADLGFKSISKLTGKEIELKRRYSESGKLKRLAFKTESFSISTKIND